MSNVTSLLSGTVTADGAAAFYADGDQAILFWNIQGPITGTLPTIQFFVSEVDPSNNSTIVGITASGLIITGTSIDQLQFSFRHSPVLLVSWVVTGASASFGNVSLTIASGNTGVTTIGSGGGTGGTVDQGTPNTPTNGWPVKVTDGTNILGISAHPVKIDPTGTTVQPVSLPTDTVVSGSIVTNGDTVQISTIGLNAVGLLASGTWTGNIAIEASVDGSSWGSTTAIEISSGIPAVAFSSPSSYQINCAGLDAIRVKATSAITGTTSIYFRASTAVSSVMLDNSLPGGTNSIGSVSLNTGSNTIGKVDQGVGGSSAWKVDGSAVTQPVSQIRPSTNTTTSIAASASNVALLSSNSSRLGATIFNDSSSMLYVKLGSTTTLTDFTIKVFPQSYYEVPYGFTGAISGLWSSATGSARVGELT